MTSVVSRLVRPVVAKISTIAVGEAANPWGLMSISIDRRVNVDTLVIAFTGFNHRLGMPNERFFESAGLADASKIVVSDESRRFTFFGLGCGLDTFEKVCDRLVHEVATTPHETLVVTGSSGGAYLAILYGHLLKANRVVCFAPYTYLDPATNPDDPALKKFERILESLEEIPSELDKYRTLRSVLGASNGVTRYHIHVSKHHEWDSRRVAELKGLPSVKVHQHPHATHGIASALAKSGRLERCFSSPERRSYDLPTWTRIVRKRTRSRLSAVAKSGAKRAFLQLRT